MFVTIPDSFPAAVFSAAGRPAVVAAVHALYARLQEQIDTRRPVCSASGACCHFETYGHSLFVTTIEMAAFFADQPKVPSAGLLPILNDGCRFQVDKLCSVHAIRPFGCRIFFCDPSATDWQQQQYEIFHQQLRQLHEQFDVPYAYLEWRAALNAVEPQRHRATEKKMLEKHQPRMETDTGR